MTIKIGKSTSLQTAIDLKKSEKQQLNIITKIALASISIGILAKLYKVYFNKTAYSTPPKAGFKAQETPYLEKNISTPQTPKTGCKTPPNFPSNPELQNVANRPFETTSNPAVNPTQQLSQQNPEEILTEMVSEFFTIVRFEQNEEKKTPTSIDSQNKSQSEAEVTPISPSTTHQHRVPSQFPLLLTEH